MTRLCLVISAIILLPLFNFAQSNYKPGLIVDLKGDTVRGFVDYKEWENNPSSVNFKPSLSGLVQQFTPGLIKYFQVDGLEAYQSYYGPISMDATNISRISTGKDTSFEKISVFLKVEQNGKYVTLYSYTDDLKKRYFIVEKKDSQPSELIYRTYNEPGQVNSNINETKYKGQLIYISSKYDTNSDDLKKEIESSNYDQDIVGIVRKINHATEQARDHKKSSLSFFAGINTAQTSIKPPNYDGNITYRNVSSSYSYQPGIAFGINIYTNPEVGRLILRGEVGLSANAIKTYYYSFYNVSSDARSYFSLNQYNLSFSPQVIYNLYNSTSFKFYLGAGAAYTLSKYTNEKVYNGLYDTTNDFNVSLGTNWLSGLASAGIVINSRVGIFANYTFPVIISGDNGYTYSSTRMGVYYTFGQKK